jgi:hypothetical protein
MVDAQARAVLAGKFEVIFPYLDERQRRLLMGAEARALGHGGIRAVASAAGVSQTTVSTGKAELDSGTAPSGRVRRPGGGRKRLTVTDPELRPALLALVEPEERGDPMSPLRWTVKSTRELARELTRQGHRVSARTVADLLHAENFSLQANAKVLAGRGHPDRDGQFRYLNEQVKDHQASGDPVVSVDAKRKERLGNHTAPGRTWRPVGDPVRVRDHDFPESGTPDPDQDTTDQDTTDQDTTDQDTTDQDTTDQDEPVGAGSAVVTPYGIYDIGADSGWVNVGTDHNTATFAVESIRRWWNDVGRVEYPAARRLLITADAGGSNGVRVRAWKAELATLATETGLEITACHFPPGTSKWNKIEHRLFSHITMNWRGRPLTSHEVVLQSIAATTTRTGLRVHAALDTASYPLGVNVTDAHLAALPLTRHDWHGDWNYTLHPAPLQTPPDPQRNNPRPQASRPTRPDPSTLTWLTHPTLTGVPTEDWDTLIMIVTALDNARSTRVSRPILPITARLTATLVNHHTRLPRAEIGRLYGVSKNTLDAADLTTLLRQIGKLPRRGPLRLANLQDLYDIAALKGIPIPDQPNPT